MDKSEKVHESQSDTSSVITMKEYAPSEYPSSEPPPAYMKPRSNALRIAKLAAFTVIVSSIILGGFILAASWIQANTARNLDLTLNQELLDDLHPSYEHLVANEVLPDQQHNAIDQEQDKKTIDENQASSNAEKILEKNKSNDEGLLPPPPPPSNGKSEEKKVLDLDEIANILMQKNLKGNVNCIVEKRRNEELVDHVPMSLNLPSLNITTPPRLQHLTGEQMIVICKGDDDEDKDSESEEDGEEEDGKVDQLQSVVFPLPSHLLNQIQQMQQVQQVPQIIPLNNILQHLQVPQVQQIPIQQVPIQQVPIQQVPIQQIQQIPIQQIPFHQFPQQVQPQLPQHQQQQPFQVLQPQPLIMEQPQPQPQQFQQPPQQIILPQKLLFPQQQIVNNQPNVQFIPEMTPLKEVRINQNRIPMNHVMHHRVPVNPMAVNDIPISRMPITHLPMRAEPQIREEPVPVHHLMPPQPQQYQAENFKQEEPKFNGPMIQEPMERFPFPPPTWNQPRPLPVEVRDPGVLRVPPAIAKESRERFSMPPPSNQFFPNNFPENREPEFVEETASRVFPRQPAVDIRSRGQRKEHPMPNTLMPEMPKINPIIPLNFERRPPPNGRRIAFPEMESEEIRENRLPIITEITKIIPIRLENEDNDVNETPMLPLNGQNKNLEHPELKLEKMSPRPFPIPINAILDMIFRGIRPLMGNRGHSLPIPIDIKIERIENKPIGMTPPFIKKFEVIKKESSNEPEDIFQNSKVQSILSEKNESETVPEKDVVEAKIERVEIFDKENENGQPIPIPADAQEPQIFKIEDQGKGTEAGESSFEDQAFLPNGQGRGARVFPIPQPVKEAEIFSVFDAKSDKNIEAEVPVESSISVMNPEKQKGAEESENRQGRFINFPGPILNFFPIPEEKIMKPLVQAPKVQPQTFSVPESRSIKLIPVPAAGMKAEELKPVNPIAEENRPHYPLVAAHDPVLMSSSSSDLLPLPFLPATDPFTTSFIIVQPRSV